MARRFTDTEKWDDPWFDNLDKDSKLLYQYLNDKCSHAGIWKINFKKMRENTGAEKPDEEIIGLFEDRVYQFDDKWLLPKFLKFQYPSGLQSNKPAIISVRKELNYYNLSEIIKQLLPNDYSIIKDKDKDIYKDKIKTKTRKPDSEQIKRIMSENYSDPKYVPKPG